MTKKTVEVFDTPMDIRISLSPISSIYLLRTGGIVGTDILLAKLSTKLAMPFVKGDRCYVNVTKPSTHDPNCTKADYIVTAINKRRQHYEITLTGRV